MRCLMAIPVLSLDLLAERRWQPAKAAEMFNTSKCDRTGQVHAAALGVSCRARSNSRPYLFSIEDVSNTAAKPSWCPQVCP